MAKVLSYLRIAFSATCVIAAVLLCVLWVRSYWRAYTLETADMAVHAQADFGVMRVFLNTPLNASLDDLGSLGYWYVGSDPPLHDNFENFPLPKPSPLKFDFDYGPGYGLYLSTPGWSLAFLAAVLAVTPWFCKLPRRFSLRMLLIATTLVAVVLGLVVWMVRSEK